MATQYAVLGASGEFANLGVLWQMPNVLHGVGLHMHICGLLEVILQGSGSAPPVPPCTKAEVAVLLLGCCPPTASSTSPDVLYGLSPGAIDGFSRKVLWLACGPTNNDPSVIAHYFLSCVRNLCVIPMRLRTDRGTENGTMAAIQCTLRHHHNDYYSRASSHMYGSSTNNQRIESWWSIFRKGRCQFWMELFADLRDAGYFNGSHEHQCLLRYCFGDVIQKDLDECVRLEQSQDLPLQNSIMSRWSEQ
ncbi:hypothetical protein L3Q82_001053 [Scortum barcoo]|uniref:Uncharacterized protein n=1 Tax=Scortum barcoo TaxID=214431 RepID=A0ACB8WDQ1_9TELE|nr:hypothetical protein L3Q82_001053 [Scortum barcoo]